MFVRLFGGKEVENSVKVGHWMPEVGDCLIRKQNDEAGAVAGAEGENK
jgi:hypothetical protein